MRKDYLYFIQSERTGHIKVGRSVDPYRRLKALQTGNQCKLRLVASFENMGWREPSLHDHLKQWRVKGEWFHVDCVGSLPIDIYEQIPYGSFDDWWVKPES